MPSSYDGPPGGRPYPADDDLPPELDPRRGRGRPASNGRQNDGRQGDSRQPARGGNRPDDGWQSAGPRQAPRAGQRPQSGDPLPPELDPRGRRAARAAAAAAYQPSPRRPERPRSDLARGALLGVKIVATLCSLLVLVGSGWAWATYRKFNADITRVNAISAKGKAANGGIDGKDQNILIVGNDDRDSASDAELAKLGTTRDGGSYNTDTMMLLHLPADGRKATVISFPRDSYVSIPGHGKNKLNSAYPSGIADGHGNKDAGAQLLVRTIENLTGLSIDHFVQIDLLGFYRISVAIHGVDVCLNHAVKEANSGIDLKAGHQTIQGTQALAFVRQRYGFPNGDLDRIKRQQYFLSAVFRKMSSAGTLLNPIKLQNLLNAVSSSLQADPDLVLSKLAIQMQNLQAGNFAFTTIPTQGFEDVQINGQTQNVVVVDSAAMPAFIGKLIGTDTGTALSKAKAADPSTVTVRVVNDTDSNGLEKTNAEALQAVGFKTEIPPATSDVVAKTEIRYAPGQESAAKAVQAQVPGAVLTASADVTGVTLVLGNNKVQVKSLMPTKAPSSSASPQPGESSSPAVTTAADAGCIN
ncbi:MAG: LCP family protein [Actinobacteria bacterium]|nr:LCP family protein [Actinomycetota bacterium]